MNRRHYNVGFAFNAVAASAGESLALAPAVSVATTYRELDALSNQLAAVFVDRGLRKGDVVGIVHDKSPRCYASMLAALKLGLIYVNIDEQNPPPRMKHIFASSQPKCVVGEAFVDSVRGATEDIGAALLEFGDDRIVREIASAPNTPRPEMADVTGADPAYIMYTSGSTGVPKGAMMTHANVLNFGAWAGARFQIGGSDVLTNLNPMYFDNSVFDFYGAMLNGAAIAPVKRDVLGDGAELMRQVEAARCTVWFSVPSLLIYLTTMKLLTADRLASIRAFVFGGEGYPKPELRKLFTSFSGRSDIINVYGPTECTCICSAWNVTRDDLADDDGLVTLGNVADNFSMVILDNDIAVEPGAIGELCLMGPQVGLGYVSNTERTGQAFCANPLNARWLERMYRTGDLVRVGLDGRRLDFIGRKDNQIKHMGYRIELEEIEAALNKLDGVVQSAVLQKSGKRGHKIIVAYVACVGSGSEAEFRVQLEAFLPPYMIPTQFVVRDMLPKNANGKIDKVALMAADV